MGAPQRDVSRSAITTGLERAGVRPHGVLRAVGVPGSNAGGIGETDTAGLSQGESEEGEGGREVPQGDHAADAEEDQVYEVDH